MTFTVLDISQKSLKPLRLHPAHSLRDDKYIVTVQQTLTTWFRRNARDLPWRKADLSPYEVLVSEIMLQQTPASRVAPQFEAWISRWPTAEALAAASPADVLRQWDRLGYPNRALRLHAAALHLAQHGLPESETDWRKLPGVGEYTAAAIQAFAFAKRSFVLDTNVRRVLSRVFSGADQPQGSITRSERELADDVTPSTDKKAALWSAAVMEFGALICTARNPMCDHCPIAKECAWRAGGYPKSEVKKRTQQFHGTVRYVRGQMMKKLRETSSVTRAELLALPENESQAHEALLGLLDDGLVEVTRNGRLRLPK